MSAGGPPPSPGRAAMSGIHAHPLATPSVEPKPTYSARELRERKVRCKYLLPKAVSPIDDAHPYADTERMRTMPEFGSRRDHPMAGSPHYSRRELARQRDGHLTARRWRAGAQGVVLGRDCGDGCVERAGGLFRSGRALREGKRRIGGVPMRSHAQHEGSAGRGGSPPRSHRELAHQKRHHQSTIHNPAAAVRSTSAPAGVGHRLVGSKLQKSSDVPDFAAGMASACTPRALARKRTVGKLVAL